MKKKMVLIGAGSAMFTQGLLADLILSEQPWQLGLVDIDPIALDIATGLCTRMLEARPADITVESSTDRRDVLPQADVVVTTIGVGGRRAWETDVFLPRTYGIYQPVGDTIMPGGISRALRMIPAMVDIARDVLAICPAARFFNYANPMTVNCWAVRKATGANVVGLCHGVKLVERELANFAQVTPAEISCLAVGVNHFTWIFDLRWRGQDLWPLIEARLAEERGQPFDGQGLGTVFPEMGAPSPARHKAADNPFSWSLFDTYHAYPAVNDRHVSEFFPERFPQGSYHGKTLGVDAFSFEQTIALGDQIYEQMKAQAMGQAPLPEKLFRRVVGEHEQLINIIDSMAQDKRMIVSANLPNRGAVPNLPSEAILEMPCAVTASGLRPLQVADFPEPLAATIRHKLDGQALTVEAALTGSRAVFVEALLADGGVTERSVAEKLADDLLQAQRAYLPQFA